MDSSIQQRQKQPRWLVCWYSASPSLPAIPVPIYPSSLRSATPFLILYSFLFPFQSNPIQAWALTAKKISHLHHLTSTNKSTLPCLVFFPYLILPTIYPLDNIPL